MSIIWASGQPADAVLKRTWWQLFEDSQLNALKVQVDTTNQNLKSAEANFRAARAQIGYSRAAEAARSLPTGAPATLQHRSPTKSGSPISPTSLQGKVGSISPRSSMRYGGARDRAWTDCPGFAELLQDWQIIAPQSVEGWVFVNPVTGKPYHAAPIQQDYFRPAGRSAGLKGELGWHSFRHSYRSMLDAAGAPIGVQQKLMRHAQVSTTMNVYGSAYMEGKRAAPGKVVEMVFSGTKQKAALAEAAS